MAGKIIRMGSGFLLTIFIIGTIALAASRLITALSSRGKIYHVEDSPSSAAAVVFGAGLWRDGSPTAVLKDRVATAADLYHAGKVQKILMSGDNRQEDYNEPQSMADYAINLGVPAEDIIRDDAGLRTYDTCYRAKNIFHLDDVILITQQFHLPRAIFTCNSMGVKATGVIADRRQYSDFSLKYWGIRETFASLVAVMDVWLIKPVPTLSESKPIFPSSRSSIDPS